MFLGDMLLLPLRDLGEKDFVPIGDRSAPEFALDPLPALSNCSRIRWTRSACGSDS